MIHMKVHVVHLIGKKIDPMLHFFKSFPKYILEPFIPFDIDFLEKRIMTADFSLDRVLGD